LQAIKMKSQHFVQKGPTISDLLEVYSVLGRRNEKKKLTNEETLKMILYCVSKKMKNFLLWEDGFLNPIKPAHKKTPFANVTAW